MVNLASIFSFILALLKLFGLISISWVGVFMPLMVGIGIWVLAFIIATILSVISK